MFFPLKGRGPIIKLLCIHQLPRYISPTPPGFPLVMPLQTSCRVFTEPYIILLTNFTLQNVDIIFLEHKFIPHKKYPICKMGYFLNWRARRDSNSRSSDRQSDMLTRLHHRPKIIPTENCGILINRQRTNKIRFELVPISSGTVRYVN